MNIARVTQLFPPKVGGQEFHAFELTRIHAQLGHNVHVFTSTNGTPELPDRATVHVTPGDFQRWLRSGSLGALAFWLAALPAIVTQHRRQPFDVIHAHGDAADALMLSWLGKRLNIPTVISVHAGLSQRWAYRTLARRAFLLPTHIMAVSPAIVRDLASMGIPQANLSVRSSGIDFAALQSDGPSQRAEMRRELDDIGAGPVIVSVGRLHPLKGFPVLIRSSGILHQAGIAHRVLIIGGGPEERHLKEMALKVPTVHFLGERRKEEIAALLKAADLFVLSSLALKGQSEGTPTALLEAMAAGVACITSSAVVVQDLIENNRNGIIVEAGDAQALARAIAELLRAPERRAAFGTAAREAVRNRDWQVVASDVMTVYWQVRGSTQ